MALQRLRIARERLNSTEWRQAADHGREMEARRSVGYYQKCCKKSNTWIIN
jgi:hypothetical protein